MLAAHHDQENILALRQGPTKNRSMAPPKTPGAMYPKTPLKVPLNDENAVGTIGGKGVLGTQGKGAINRTLGKAAGKQPLATPMEPRSRAPLGNKTTNAKARTGPATTVKDRVAEIDKGNAKPTTVKRPLAPARELSPVKVEVRDDREDEACVPDVEYAPPRPKEEQYQSDICPDGCLTFEGLKPENLMRGYYEHYYNPVGEDGRRLKERELTENMRKAAKKAEEQALREVEEFDWSVSDVPETKPTLKKKLGASSAGAPQKRLGGTVRQPSTIASRKAATVLSSLPGSGKENARPAAVKPNVQKRPAILAPLRASKSPLVTTRDAPSESTAAEVTSRSTLGYNKGRSASSLVKPGPTTARAGARPATERAEAAEAAKPFHDHEPGMKSNLLSLFQIDDNEPLERPDLEEEEEDFVLTLGP